MRQPALTVFICAAGQTSTQSPIKFFTFPARHAVTLALAESVTPAEPVAVTCSSLVVPALISCEWLQDSVLVHVLCVVQPVGYGAVCLDLSTIELTLPVFTLAVPLKVTALVVPVCSDALADAEMVWP